MKIRCKRSLVFVAALRCLSGALLADGPNKENVQSPAGYQVAVRPVNNMFERDAEAASDLGTLSALTGDEKYAKYARKLLLAYARCSEWGASPIYNVRSEIGMSGALLGEAFCMMPWAWGYNLPAWTREDWARLHDDFSHPMALTCLYPTWPGAHRDAVSLHSLPPVTEVPSDGRFFARGKVGGWPPRHRPRSSVF